MKRKLLVILLILSLLAGLLALPATAATVLASGDCGKTGNDVTWTLDRDGLLTVSGTGEMADYDNADDVPWHSYLSLVTSVVIQSGVETVGKNAFQSCTNLESVTLPAQGLRSIGDVAFYHCDALAAITYPEATATVTLPEGVEDIGDNAFGFCALTTFHIPASVATIGESALYKCTALTEITVSEENTAFSAADGILFNKDQTELIWYPAQKSLTEYTLPESVREIGNYAFNSCPTLNKVTFPAVEDGGLEEIGEYAFAYSAVSELTIPVSMTTVGDYAFYECTGLSDNDGNAVGAVNYGGNRQQWSALVMGTGNYRLTNSNIIFGDMRQDNVVASGECGSLGNNVSWSLNIEGEFRISGKGTMRDYRSANSVPWAAYGDGEEATDLRPQILTAIVSEGVTNLGDYAFYDCENLTSVQLPSTMESIGSSGSAYSRVFYNCAALTDINLSATAATSIGNYAFNGCAALASVAFPDTLLTIGGRAFLNCTALTAVTIPASVTSVGEWAFRGCTALTSFTMEPLSRNATPHYTSLGAYVLADCAALTNVSFTENLTVLGDYALTRCEQLREVTLPASVSGVGNCAFLSCPVLAAVNVDEQNQTYCTLNSMLMNKDQTYILYYPAGRNSTACSIPESVTSVAAFAFQDARILRDVYYSGGPRQWADDVLPNIGRPNDPLFTIIENTEEEHLHCEGTDPDTDTSNIDYFAPQQTEDGVVAMAQVHCGSNTNLNGLFAWCAMYDAEGRFLGIASGAIEEEGEGGEEEEENAETLDGEDTDGEGSEEDPAPGTQILELSVPGQDYRISFTPDDEAVTLYLLIFDGENRPQCPRRSCQIEA